MKRFFSALFLPVLVSAFACTTDNNRGSLDNDSGVADGRPQAARDGQAPPADAGSGDLSSTDAALPDAAGASKDTAQPSSSADAAPPDAAGATQDTAQPSSSADAALPDAAGSTKDVAQESPDAGAASPCHLNPDGTCEALVPNTQCTPFLGYLYDDGAGCRSAAGTALGCCAGYCELGSLSSCYEVAANGGTASYIVWNTISSDRYVPPGAQACDPTSNASIHGASTWECGKPWPDAAVPSDAGGVLMTPTLPAACSSDGDCCVADDSCMAVSYLVGQADYAPMVASIAQVNSGLRPCVDCGLPAIQVQCEGGFCVGKKLPNASGLAPFKRSHCGSIALPDAGTAPAVSPHALGDGGQSSQTSWNCGS